MRDRLSDARVHLIVAVVLAVARVVASGAGSGPTPEPEPATTMDRLVGPPMVPPIPRMVNHDEATCPGCIRRMLRDR